MLEYYRKNPFISFGFVAAPDLEKDLVGKSFDQKNGSRRFRFYQRMMITLFGPETFLQVSDTTHTIYLMVNRQQLIQNNFTIKNIEDKLNQIYSGGYVLDN